MEIEASLERIYPDEAVGHDLVEQDSIELHMARYRYAADRIVGKRLLDIASGCGYGTALLAQAAPQVFCTGVDIDPKAIAYATQRYSSQNICFMAGDGMAWQSDELFDTIVSLETIEHLPDPHGFVHSLSRMLAPGGVIIASVPITPTKDGNPYHLHDFTRKSFLKMFARAGLVPTGSEFVQVQKYLYVSRMFRPSPPKERTGKITGNIRRYYLKHPTALLTRIWALCRYGFNNHYLTAEFRRG